MPQLSNIQTYEKLEGSDYLPTLTRFANVLKNIGIWNNELQKFFASVRLEDDIDGGVCFSINPPRHYFCSKFSSEIKIWPYFTVYSSVTDPTFTHNWICCELLMESEFLRNRTDGKNYYHVLSLVRNLAKEMFKEFSQPVFFTDEAQDGEDFDGIRTIDKNNLWNFDYAVIPLSLQTLYDTIPRTHRISMHDSYIEAFYCDNWETEQRHR